MDFGKIIERAKAILTTPRTEWPIAATEPATVGGLYGGYIAILAALPALAAFIKGSLLGSSAFGITVRMPIGYGIGEMLLRYILTLVLAYVVALIINALAPTFGGQKDTTQALKTVAYAWTAYWVAGIAVIVPWLGWLIAILGGIYSIYLLYLGLPHTMKCPPDKAAGYTAVSVIIAIVLGWIIGIILSSFFAVGALGGGAMSGMQISASDGSSVKIDSNSALGVLAAMGQRAEQAGKEMDAAQKSGDAHAQQAAVGKMMGAISGTNGTVQALAPDQIKTFLPDSLGSLKRTSISAQRNNAMGMQVSDASAEYASDSGQHITLEVTDTGGAKGFVAMAAAMAPEDEKETDHGYDKTHTVDGNLVHEAWDTQSRSGEYSVVLGQRFTVKASGNADSIDQLKQAVASVDLGKLESMKDAGVKSD
ncbi:Yip1 family protein [Rhodanobacter sp. C01]|uniref:Yip1 family protein n=1 Tax=Rhodanobacter sp. C01 TaxID=1945856 RepID=UPI000986A5B4|nr:Yip1 family protein [Rhodanobacter sp. C01]OOG49442.1 YIP1 family protein [Rhodanobacter sp. C01]